MNVNTEAKILIVDDSQHVHTLLKLILKKEGVTSISSAMNGIDGIKMAEDLRPDLIFLDNVMPKMSGLEVLAGIKNATISAKIVMLSSVISESGVKRAKELGADYYIIKPFTPEKIKQVVHKFLSVEVSELENK